MAITINLEARAEAALRERANVAGVSVEELAQQILQRESQATSAKYHPKVEAFRQKVEPLRGRLGPVPEGALDSEFLYGERA